MLTSFVHSEIDDTIIFPMTYKKPIELKEDVEEIYKDGLDKINPNFSYVFEEHIDILNNYFEKHNPKLSVLFLKCTIGEFPYYFKQDRDLKELLLSKFHGNPNYRIFDIREGFIELRRMSNKDVINVMKNIISDIVKFYGHEKVENLVLKFKEIEENFQEARKEYAKSQNIPIDPSNLTEIQKMDKLREKLYGITPLY